MISFGLERELGGFHPIFVHFPIVFLSLAALLDLREYVCANKRISHYANWLFLLGGITILPSIATGLFASLSHADNAYLQLHQTMAFFLFAVVSAQLVVRVFYIKNKFLLPNKHVVLLSCTIFILTGLTGDVGGILSRGSSPFVFANRTQEVDYNSLDTPEVASFSPEELNKYLEKNVNVLDVIPVFARYKCASCHKQYFEGDAPEYFSKEWKDSSTWLPRDGKNQLVDWKNSTFYKTVILRNKMPLDEEKNALGISWSERLILLRWLENGAPVKVPENLFQPTEEEE